MRRRVRWRVNGKGEVEMERGVKCGKEWRGERKVSGIGGGVRETERIQGKAEREEGIEGENGRSRVEKDLMVK